MFRHRLEQHDLLGHRYRDVDREENETRKRREIRLVDEDQGYHP